MPQSHWRMLYIPVLLDTAVTISILHMLKYPTFYDYEKSWTGMRIARPASSPSPCVDIVVCVYQVGLTHMNRNSCHM
jgi:hypothetical protein